jgi:hypothetical protein
MHDFAAHAFLPTLLRHDDPAFGRHTGDPRRHDAGGSQSPPGDRRSGWRGAKHHTVPDMRPSESREVRGQQAGYRKQ